MLKDEFNVIVLILTDNCADRIDRSIQSVLSQSFEPRRLKIVAIDNCSSDGTYEKLIEHLRRDDIALYRLPQRDLPTRVLRTALYVLEPVAYRYITVLDPGDQLYPDYIEICTTTMEQHPSIDRTILLCEIDTVDQTGKVFPPAPAFTDSCILMKREHYTQFFMHGIGHKIQCFYSVDAIPLRLPELPFCVDHSDWFKKAHYCFSSECIYIKSPLARRAPSRYDDPLYELILRLHLVKRLELIQNAVFVDDVYEVFHRLNRPEITYGNLARLALRFALVALDRTDRETARRILLFAEMVDSEIPGTDLYAALDRSIQHGGAPPVLEDFVEPQNSVAPPDGAIIIDTAREPGGLPWSARQARET